MFGQVAAGQPLDLAIVLPRQIELEFRRRVKRCRAFGNADRLNNCVSFLQPVIILGGEADFQRAVDGAARHVVEGNAGRLVRDDIEQPLLTIGGYHAAFGDIHREGARCQGLIRQRSLRRNRDITARAVGPGCLGSELLQGARHFRFEGHFFAAITTGHADRQPGGLRHGNRVAVGRVTPSQENRCTAGIRGRRNPGVQSNIGIERTHGRLAAEGIGNRACAVGKGKTEGSGQKKGGNGA